MYMFEEEFPVSSAGCTVFSCQRKPNFPPSLLTIQPLFTHRSCLMWVGATDPFFVLFWPMYRKTPALWNTVFICNSHHHSSAVQTYTCANGETSLVEKSIGGTTKGNHIDCDKNGPSGRFGRLTVSESAVTRWPGWQLHGSTCPTAV